MPTLIGITGRRGVGKSTAADYLVEAYGFTRVHPFGAGKKATEAWLRCYVPADVAMRMVNGDLKDVPCDMLPGGASPRFFMEKFGRFMGGTLGPDWTLGMEIRRARAKQADKLLVVESIVYEESVIRDAGGIIIRIERAGVALEAVETDAAQAKVAADLTVINNGQFTELYRQLDSLLQG